jgi:hypothetical protein
MWRLRLRLERLPRLRRLRRLPVRRRMPLRRLRMRLIDDGAFGIR